MNSTNHPASGLLFWPQRNGLGHFQTGLPASPLTPVCSQSSPKRKHDTANQTDAFSSSRTRKPEQGRPLNSTAPVSPDPSPTTLLCLTACSHSGFLMTLTSRRPRCPPKGCESAVPSAWDTQDTRPSRLCSNSRLKETALMPQHCQPHPPAASSPAHILSTPTMNIYKTTCLYVSLCPLSLSTQDRVEGPISVLFTALPHSALHRVDMGQVAAE